MERYVSALTEQLEQADSRTGVALFIAESIAGCAGQVVYPDGYLEQAFERVRAYGGICISDEVQVGFGRVGSHWWAFQPQNALPDIVTLGKPIGNGHPLAAVITTREIAEAFDNGMEYFNTFGGNPVSCAIGNAVLDVMEAEDLQSNALVTGNALLDQLRRLQSDFSVIGDVRGRGLFIGIELVKDPTSRQPAGNQAQYVAERMKQEGILISTDGPNNNVLKIKPPMCFDQSNVAECIHALETILQEDCAQPAFI